VDYLNHTDDNGSDHEGGLFQSDILAPHEYWRIHRPNRFRQPEFELMLAVLEDALQCFFTNVQMRSRREKRIFTETEEWFLCTENEGAFTFENICSVLGLDSDYIRGGLGLFKSACRTRDKSSTAAAA
jgi:hypothetical protein